MHHFPNLLYHSVQGVKFYLFRTRFNDLTMRVRVLHSSVYETNCAEVRVIKAVEKAIIIFAGTCQSNGNRPYILCSVVIGIFMFCSWQACDTVQWT